MKANELMIGDWAKFNSGYGKVTGITDAGVHFEDRFGPGIASGADPIPLYPEILEKNGFVPYEDDRDSFHDKNCVFIKQSSGGYGVCIDKKRTISGLFHYVHELQHAMRLCGIEKEITIEKL